MTPHAVIALLDQEQTYQVLLTCCQFLEVDSIERALREGLEATERRQLAYQLSIEFDSDTGPDESS